MTAAPFYSRTMPWRVANEIINVFAANGTWYEVVTRGKEPATIKVQAHKQRELDKLVDRYDT